MNSIQIDIISDVVCPWCIIGYKRFEKAIAQFEDTQFEIEWHPFEINPQMPLNGQNLRTHLREKYGTTLENSIASRKRLTDLGASLGFTFSYYDDMKMYNTQKAHQLIHWAKEEGKQTPLKLALFAAYFSEQKDVSDDNVLVDTCEQVGLSGDTARAIIQEGKFKDLVRNEELRWLDQGVHGVPAFILDKKYMVSGGQEPEVFAQVIRRVLEERLITS